MNAFSFRAAAAALATLSLSAMATFAMAQPMGTNASGARGPFQRPVPPAPAASMPSTGQPGNPGALPPVPGARSNVPPGALPPGLPPVPEVPQEAPAPAGASALMSGNPLFVGASGEAARPVAIVNGRRVWRDESGFLIETLDAGDKPAPAKPVPKAVPAPPPVGEKLSSTLKTLDPVQAMKSRGGKLAGVVDAQTRDAVKAQQAAQAK